MNNNKNKSLKIQTLCLVATFAFFAGECFCREVLGGTGGETRLPKKYDLGYKEDKNIIKNAQKRISGIENTVTSSLSQKNSYIGAHKSEINRNKNLIELVKNLTDSKKRYNELVDKLSKPNINGTEKQRLSVNLSEVANELAERENHLKQNVPNYKPDSPKVSNLDKFSVWFNQFLTKKIIGAGDRYLLKKMKEEELLNNNTNETEQPLKNPSEENPKSDDSNIKWLKETFSYYLNREKSYFSTNKNTDDNGDKQLENSSKKDDSKLNGDKTRQSENLLKNNNQTSSNITNDELDPTVVLNAGKPYWLDPENIPNVNAGETEQSKNSSTEDDSKEDGNGNNQQSKGSSTGDNSESDNGKDKQSGGLSTENSMIADNTSAEEKANLESLKEDNIKKVFTPEEIFSDVVSMISTPTTNIISERLSLDNSVIAAGSNSNLVASADNNSINLGDSNDSYEVWSKMHYNYSSNSNRSIHIFGLTIGGECGFKNNKYKIGLAYTFNNGNGSKYISNSISLYSSINDINIKDFRNNFANVILTYGRLNTNIVKNENKLVAIKHGYGTDLISLNTIFGHNIVLPNSNGIVTPTIGIRYDYINRNTYTNNALKHGELSMNIITPTAGVSYINKVLNDNLTIKVGVNLGYGFNLNNKTNIILKTTNNSHSETIGYTSTNALTGNFNFGLAYKVKKNIELSFDSNISYGINETFNAGFSFGGRYQF